MMVSTENYKSNECDGATKRMCENDVQSAEHTWQSKIQCATRSAKYLGSAGSVIPYSKEQIRKLVVL